MKKNEMSHEKPLRYAPPRIKLVNVSVKQLICTSPGENEDPEHQYLD